MEATFVLKPEELTTDWLEQLKNHFSADGTITITAIGPEKPVSVEEQRIMTQQAMFARLRESQKKHPPMTIPAHIDINEMIDEMYWKGNH